MMKGITQSISRRPKRFPAEEEASAEQYGRAGNILPHGTPNCVNPADALGNYTMRTGAQRQQEKGMKLNQIDQVNEKELNRRIRYRVTLTAKVGGNTIFWQARLNGNSPGEAVMTAHQLFRKERGEIQSAVMSRWELREVTPIKKVESV